ncbi:MAG TPA: group 1 truncated hemoglobin [Streptosporangiaceae bacterium]|nr:group 1 truncated hemoglobin [Streptosporangiaceae bacterium]
MTSMITPSSSDSSTSVAAPISLYEAIGGHASVTAAVDIFYAKMLADPVVSKFFPGGVGPVHRAHIATVLCEALGGPERYHGPDLAEAHRDHAISDTDFDITAGHLAATLQELGVPDNMVGQIIEIVAGLRPIVVTA